MPLSQAEVVNLGDSCREVYTEQVEAWDSGDLDRIRDVYTEDIVHFDGHPAYVGIDDVMGMARMMLMFFSNWSMKVGRTYISASDCLGTWVNWDLMGFTEDNPGREFDLVDIRENKIAYWRLFYDENFDFSPINTALLENFAAGWSSGDPQAVAALYAEDALLEDSMFGISASGRDKIGSYARGFWNTHPNAAWELLFTFSEGADLPDLIPSNGGIYQISSGQDSSVVCPVQMAVLLTPDPDGLITTQQTLYSAQDLIQCGWVK